METFSHLGWFLPRFITEIITAIICGGLISLERAMRQRSILFRDNILVCVGVVLLMIVGELISITSADENQSAVTAQGEHYMIISQQVSLDSTDAIQQQSPPPVAEHSELIVTGVIIGISLLGLGVVVRQNPKKSDLSTQGGFADAATIWVVAATGLIIGSGNPLLGLLVTCLMLLTLMFATGLERYFRKKPRPLLLKLTVREDNPEIRKKLQEILERHDIKADSFRSERSPQGIRMTIQAPEEPKNLREMTTHLWTLQGVTEVEH